MIGCGQPSNPPTVTGLPLAVEQGLEQQGVAWLPSPIALGDHPFIDQRNKTMMLSDLKGAWSLAFFGFTSCPDICPMTLGKLSKAKQRTLTEHKNQIKKSANNDNETVNPKNVQIVLITVDPARDKPAALKPYLSYFSEDIIGLTGNPDSLAKISTELHAFYAKVEQHNAAAEQSYTMDHSANIVVISPTGDYLGYISPPHSVDQLTAIIQILEQLKPKIAARASFTTNVIDWIRLAQR